MRFNLLPSSMSTLVSRKPSIIGLRTKAAGARAVQNLGSSLALKVIAVSLHGFIAATWQTSARPRSARLRLLFEAKVSKTVNSVLLFSAGWCSAVLLMRRSSPLLATCRSTQHALRLWVGVASSVLWSLHGPLSHSSNTARPGVGFGFLGIGSDVL